MTTRLTPPVAPSPPGDVLIAGAGVVGLSLALALARAGLKCVVLGPAPVLKPGRTVALLDGSVRLMRRLHVWPRLAGKTAALATMRIVDETPSLFRPPPLDFHAAELGLEAFGHNVENADLEAALAEEAEHCPTLVWHKALLTAHHVDPDLVRVTASDGATFETALLIAADGARSSIRAEAGIGIREKSYPQVALTAVLRHAQPHRNVSTEFHTREGPFTLVPLAGAPDAPHRSSLVWVMAPRRAEDLREQTAADLAAAIERRASVLLGGIAIEGKVGAFPIRRLVAKSLVGPRLVLIGEAAHALPPIGAQGLNLSLRDVEVLAERLASAARNGGDTGAPERLSAYERARAGDVAVRAAAVDSLNAALLAGSPASDLLRGVGMSALARLGPLRRAVMRQGLMASDASRHLGR